MKNWYLGIIEVRFQEWCSLIETNPKEALSKMQDINNYRTMLRQRS